MTAPAGVRRRQLAAAVTAVEDHRRPAAIGARAHAAAGALIAHFWRPAAAFPARAYTAALSGIKDAGRLAAPAGINARHDAAAIAAVNHHGRRAAARLVELITAAALTVWHDATAIAPVKDHGRLAAAAGGGVAALAVWHDAAAIAPVEHHGRLAAAVVARAHAAALSGIKNPRRLAAFAGICPRHDAAAIAPVEHHGCPAAARLVEFIAAAALIVWHDAAPGPRIKHQRQAAGGAAVSGLKAGQMNRPGRAANRELAGGGRTSRRAGDERGVALWYFCKHCGKGNERKRQ